MYNNIRNFMYYNIYLKKNVSNLKLKNFHTIYKMILRRIAEESWEWYPWKKAYGGHYRWACHA
jgi:hypothetical protein